MALTFKTADLVKLIDQIIAAKHAEDEREATDKINARARHQRNWLANNTPKVRDLRDYLTRSLKNGTPPTTSEARKIMGQDNNGYSGYVQLFAEGGDGNVTAAKQMFWRFDELAGLSELLKAHTGETITAHQLKELGTHPRDLEKLFRAASVAKAVVGS